MEAITGISFNSSQWFNVWSYDMSHRLRWANI